jgi:hypothetical protein
MEGVSVIIKGDISSTMRRVRGLRCSDSMLCLFGCVTIRTNCTGVIREYPHKKLLSFPVSKKKKKKKEELERNKQAKKTIKKCKLPVKALHAKL